MAGGKFSVETPSAHPCNLQAQASEPENFSPALDATRQFGWAAPAAPASAGQLGTSGIYLGFPVDLMSHQTEGQPSQATCKDHQGLGGFLPARLVVGVILFPGRGSTAAH